MGEDLCTKCKFEDEVIRWQEAAMRAINPDDDEWDIKLRREKLLQAKFMELKSVEIKYRAIQKMAEAIWGGLPRQYMDLRGAHPFPEDNQQTFPFESVA